MHINMLACKTKCTVEIPSFCKYLQSIILCARCCSQVMDQVFFFKAFFLYLFFYFWQRWVFVAARGLSLVVASGGYSSLQCVGFSLWWPLLLWSTGSRHTSFSSCNTQAQQLWLTGSRAQAWQLWLTGLSCSVVCGIFLDQGLNLCPLHWQADSQPLRHEGRPMDQVFKGLQLFSQ